MFYVHSDFLDKYVFSIIYVQKVGFFTKNIVCCLIGKNDISSVKGTRRSEPHSYLAENYKRSCHIPSKSIGKIIGVALPDNKST